MKMFTVVTGCIFIALMINGCGNTKNNTKIDDNVKQDDKSEIYIPIISKGWQHQFWQSVKMGANKAAKELNVEITFQGPENDAAVSKQIEMIDSAISKKPDAIVLSACDSKAVVPELEKAKAANIPIIGFDSGVESNIAITTVATDNFAASGAAADKLATAIGEEGEIAVLCHDGISITGSSRRDGFINRINNKYPKIKIVDIEYGGGDHAISKELANKIIEGYPNIKGIFATNEGSAVGLIDGITENNKVGKITIVGFDSGKWQKDAIRNGVMLGAVSQNPIEIGYKAVEAAYKASKGESLEKFIDTGYKWYDKTNVDSEEMKMLLYN